MQTSNPKKRPRAEISQSFLSQQEMQYFEPRRTREQIRRVDTIAEQLRFLESHEMVALKHDKHRALPSIKYRRNFTLNEQRCVIFLRFGSLDSMERAHHTSKEVFQQTGVKPSAQYMMIKRWIQNGMRVVSRVSQRGPGKMLSYSDRVYIANPKTLMTQRHLSLAQRAEVLRRDMNLPNLSAMTVWRVYQELGAKFIKPKIVYRSKNERQKELCEKQQQFSSELIKTMIDFPKVEIVYVDETTFNLWQAPSRIWLKPGMRVELPNQRGHSITMIGAISTQRGLFHTHTFASTNTSETFIDFVVGLKAKCQDRACIVVMDNLSVHKTKTVKGLFDGQFQQMFLPPQSCELNPIEKAWNIIKSQWRKTSYLILENNLKTEVKIADSVRMLRDIADNQDMEKMKKVAHCNYKTMALTLRGHLV